MREFNKPLSDVEAITDFRLIAQPFTQENGELTPTMKLRRRVVQEHYRGEIESMYGDADRTQTAELELTNLQQRVSMEKRTGGRSDPAARWHSVS